ncbi:MAG: YfhO family protein, partial [Verrucomicrobiota bacterium]|nr:YfhO family protein [Verrucomicrobiota bacterium]
LKRDDSAIVRGEPFASNMNPAPEQRPDAPVEHPLQGDTPSWMDVFTPGRLAGLILLLLFAMHPGVLLGTHSFFFSDFGVFTYPVAYYAHESFWRGQVPLWNPLNNCGVPFLAQWNTSVCYPLSLIYMIFPLPQSLNYFCLGHLLLAGVGMYFLAQRWTQNRLAASIAGLVFALNGVMLSDLMWTSNLAALSWQPWVTLWAEQAWRTGGRRIVLAAWAGAMQMLSGGPEIIFFTWTLLGMLWLSQTWRKQIPFGPSWRRFVVMVVLVAGLSAIQLFPFFDLLKHSERSSAYAVADVFSMPIWGWANFVVPFFRCLRTPFGTCVQSQQPCFPSYYLGLGTLMLVAVAVWRRRWRLEIYGLAGMTLAAMLLALGGNAYVYSWLKCLLPWIGFSRYPIKFVWMVAFTIPLLAALGIDAFQSGSSREAGMADLPASLDSRQCVSSDERKRRERGLFLIAAFQLLAASLILAAARWCPAAGNSDWQLAWRDGGIRSLFLIATVGVLCALVRVPSSRTRGLLGLAVLALIGFDLVTAGLRTTPSVVVKAFDPLELNMSSTPKLGASRAMVSRQVLSFLDLSSALTKNPLYYYAGLRGALIENCNIPDNIPKVDGFWSLHLGYEWNIDGIFYGVYRDNRFGGYTFGTNALPAPLLNFLGVSQISAPNTIFAWRARKSFLPLVTAGQRPIFAGDSETLKKLQSPDFDPRRTVYLPWSTRNEVNVTNASKTKIVFQRFGAQRARLTVEAPAPALVVIAQAFYHDWHAFVDGQPVPLLRANHAFQAVEVPAGRHEITLRYEDWAFRIGAMVSALTLAGCLAGFFAKARP